MMAAPVRTTQVAVAAVALAGIALWGSGPATAAPQDVNTRVGSWDNAASTLGVAGSLWKPTWTASLASARGLDVVADALTFARGAVTGGSTYASATYGGEASTLTVQEKWSGTRWAVAPDLGPRAAVVDRVTLRLGVPGMRYSVRATVYANCGPVRTRGDVIPSARPCSRSDVLRRGGAVSFTMRPASTMTAPGTTAVVVRSSGLTYRQLLHVARSLEQVPGEPTVAGSAQMVGMCQQMADERMTADQAAAFAAESGYTTRVGSADGEQFAVTLDYRPDRFTLALEGGAVTSCTYG
ncbi:MAG: hypothetical protein GC156_12270 [Actinomycetales bacterium]|nr:hypothetical protein [Actinomycetales bacterium]